ncbi:MAG: acetyl-CoA carboxylase carboxyltransferase subunit alpha [Clostridiales bacterium]|nr:acetyl-CoA carboxylase carboxyltransferase subunit alpha [Clostridiales bacterium]
MTAYDRLRATRQNHRPTGADYVNGIFTGRVELHGDRRFGDDDAIVGGVGFIEDIPVTFIAIDKGSDIQQRIKKNFGCPKPEGYRKALRLMKQAEKFNRPVVCFVDTQGAYAGAEAEERGQGEAIAENILEMMGLGVPCLTVIIGEGGSGGALALAAADRVHILENAVYSVISPEGCASILWKDAGKVANAADALHITAQDMVDFKVADNIIPENFEQFDRMCDEMRNILVDDLKKLSKLSSDELRDQRYKRFRRFGEFDKK